MPPRSGSESEWQTRKSRIDPRLQAAGWEVVPFVEGRPLSGYTGHAIEEYPTSAGPADYALVVNGRLLGIVEAKKHKVGAQGVLPQAERYSRGITDSPLDFRGYRVPFLYSTNGENIRFWDVRDELNLSRWVQQFHSPSALEGSSRRHLKRQNTSPSCSPSTRPSSCFASRCLTIMRAWRRSTKKFGFWNPPRAADIIAPPAEIMTLSRMGNTKGMAKRIRAIDLFCGAGGSSWGARLAGAQIVAGFDEWELAGDAFMENFPEAWFYESRLQDLKPREVGTELGRIDLILASPECTNHSPAKGNGPRCEASKETAFQVTRFARALKPRWVVVENVTSMRNWSRYNAFISTLKCLGYRVTPQILNAEQFGVSQTRRRLFLLCDRERKPSAIARRSIEPKPASSIVDNNGKYPFAELRIDRRAAPTLQRADRAIASVGKESFLLVYYGSDKAGGWQDLRRPLRTITTLDRFAFVKWQRQGHVMRMLQVPELKAAMGMPQKFSVGSSTRRNQIRMIGNAVCPPVMRAVVRSLTREG